VNASAAASYYSYVDGKRWDFSMSHKDIEESPHWLDTDDNPPLPPGAAVRAARVLLPQLLPHSDTERWSVTSVALNEVLLSDTWVYEVTFMGPGPCDQFVLSAGAGGCGSSGGVPTIHMMVLMNGHAVVPVSTKWPAGS
jgi:hypothetical protein